MNTNHFIFDANKCVGCQACVLACVNENGFQGLGHWRSVTSTNVEKVPGLPLFYLSMACNHCDEAPCMKYCPALAFKRSEITGAVIHEEGKCIGCNYCTWQCPYEAPKFNANRGVIEKCTFCESRLLNNQKPACTSLCPTGALDFSKQEFDTGNPEALLNVKNNPIPKIKVLHPINEAGPKIDTSLFDGILNENTSKTSHKNLSAWKEWPLLLFTLICSFLAAFSVSKYMDVISPGGKLVMITMGVLAGILSFMHLGKKIRAWRAILNIKNSWLSREVFFYSIFVLLLCLHFTMEDFPTWLYIPSSLALCISIDALYLVVQKSGFVRLHSAQSILIVATIWSFWFGNTLLILIMVGIRMALFIYQSIGSFHTLSLEFGFRLVRLILLLMVVVMYFQEQPILYQGILLVVGEAIDRLYFYNELKLPDFGKMIKYNDT